MVRNVLRPQARLARLRPRRFQRGEMGHFGGTISHHTRNWITSRFMFDTYMTLSSHTRPGVASSALFRNRTFAGPRNRGILPRYAHVRPLEPVSRERTRPKDEFVRVESHHPPISDPFFCPLLHHPQNETKTNSVSPRRLSDKSHAPMPTDTQSRRCHEVPSSTGTS